MKKLFIVICLIMSGLFTQVLAQAIKGSGKLKQQEITVAKFTQLRTYSCLNLILTQENNKIEIEADENLITLIDIKSVDGVLTIKDPDNKWFSSKHILKIYIPAQYLTLLENYGSGNISAQGELDVTSFDFTNQGSGNVNLELATPQLVLNNEGSGNIGFTGRATNATLTLRGSGNFNGGMLETDTTKVELSGSGNAQIQCNGKLNIAISGTGNLTYLGSPQVVKEVSGAGKVFPK